MTDDDPDVVMERRIAAWLARQPNPPAHAPVLVTTPVVDDRWLTYTKASEETSISRRTLQAMVAAGELDTRRTLRGHVRIRAGSLWQSETRRVG